MLFVLVWLCFVILLGFCSDVVWLLFGLVVVWLLFGRCLVVVWLLFGCCLVVVWLLLAVFYEPIVGAVDAVGRAINSNVVLSADEADADVIKGIADKALAF